jgi:hypothetical protein
MKPDKKEWEKIIENIFQKAKSDPEYATKKLNLTWFTGFINSKVLQEEVALWKVKIVRRESTVIERISAIAKRFNLTVTDEDKINIGIIAKDTFFANPQNRYLRKETITEPSGDVIVNIFPSAFIRVLDAIIFCYYKLNIEQEVQVSDTMKMP